MDWYVVMDNTDAVLTKCPDDKLTVLRVVCANCECTAVFVEEGFPIQQPQGGICFRGRGVLLANGAVLVRVQRGVPSCHGGVRRHVQEAHGRQSFGGYVLSHTGAVV